MAPDFLANRKRTTVLRAYYFSLRFAEQRTWFVANVSDKRVRNEYRESVVFRGSNDRRRSKRR